MISQFKRERQTSKETRGRSQHDKQSPTSAKTTSRVNFQETVKFAGLLEPSNTTSTDGFGTVNQSFRKRGISPKNAPPNLQGPNFVNSFRRPSPESASK